MAVVKMDEKGRIQLPSTLRAELKLKPRQPLVVRKEGEHLLVKKAEKIEPNDDPLLRDILINPGHSKVKVTKKLLNKLRDELWSG